jgi:hypothetical protein
MIAGEARNELRRQLRERLHYMPQDGDAALRAYRLRALLEELGIRCDETAELEELDAALIASDRGADALIAARLDDDERLLAYARIVARLLVGEMHPPLDAKMEYTGPAVVGSTREREEDAMVRGLARALVDGGLEAAPRPLYDDDVPKLTFAFTPRTAARSTLGGLHQWSVLWYKRSNMYRRWRSRRDVSRAIAQISVVLDRPLVAS